MCFSCYSTWLHDTRTWFRQPAAERRNAVRQLFIHLPVSQNVLKWRQQIRNCHRDRKSRRVAATTLFFVFRDQIEMPQDVFRTVYHFLLQTGEEKRLQDD